MEDRFDCNVVDVCNDWEVERELKYCELLDVANVGKEGGEKELGGGRPEENPVRD